MKTHYLFFIFLFVVLCSCRSKIEVDAIVSGAHMYTVDDNFTIVKAMAIHHGKIIEIGSAAKIQSKYFSETILDFKGKYIYPGFIDPHCHFVGYANTLGTVNLVGSKSFIEVIDRCKQQYKKQATPWVIGRGWDQNDWDVKVFPTKESIDSAFPDVPVFLRRIDGHAVLVNSKAMELAGVNKNTKIEGGAVELKNGEPTGILIDQAMVLVERCIPNASIAEKEQNILLAQNNCFAVGLTSIGDAGLFNSDIHFIDSMQKQGNLKMNIYAMLVPSLKNINEFVVNGYFKTDALHIRSIKLYADGALGSRGACLLYPYSDDVLNYGMIVVKQDSLEKLCHLADSFSYQVNTHCIGDSANRMMLNMYGRILKDRNNKRWRIEHAQVIAPNDFDLFGKFSIIPSVQTTHCTSDMYWADERLGEERIVNAYAWQKLLKQNNWLINGSDFPVESINPLYGFYAAITRQDQNEYPEGGFYSQEKLSRTQALKAMTIWAARAQFEENEKGSLEVGKSADFVVASTDIMTCNPIDIYNLAIEQTYINGQIVYNKDSIKNIN